jgi:hypothetical protein
MKGGEEDERIAESLEGKRNPKPYLRGQLLSYHLGHL